MKKSIFLIMAMLILISFCPKTANANSAEPPELIVIALNAPKDFSVAVVYDNDKKIVGRKTTVAWETYYTFYDSDFVFSVSETPTFFNGPKEITLSVTGNGTSYEQTIKNELLSNYDRIVTLDFVNHTLTYGTLPLRSVILVALRVIMTLIFEGIVFFIFGFQNRKSWIAFLIINLITQLGLNIYLNNNISPFESYPIIYLIIGEFYVFIAEIFGFLIFVRESRACIRLIYVITANFLSLILGGYLISLLPI